MDKELLEQIERMCDIILGDKSFNKDLDSLALYVGHALKQLQNTAHNSDYAKCHKHEFENIVCDMESALYAQHETNKNILSKSIKSVKAYINEHFA